MPVTGCRAATVLAATLCLSRAAAGSSWIVPGIANTSGAGGEYFQSGCSAFNPDGTLPATVTVSLIPGLGQLSLAFTTVSIPPHATTSIAPEAFTREGTGALRVVANRPIGLFCSIESHPFKEFHGFVGGGNLPAVDESQLLTSGEVGHAIWVSHAPSSPKGDRTNVAVVFPDAAGGSATVTLFDDRGSALGARSYDVREPAFLQERLDAFTSRAVPVGRIAMKVTRGRAYGYSGMINAVTSFASPFTSDVTIFPTERLVSEGLDAITSGVAYTPAWKTDVRLANPGRESLLVTADLIAESPDVSPPQAQWTLSAGQTIEIKNILQSSFSVPSGTTGAIVWRSTAPVAVAARTGWPSATDYVPGFTSGTLATTPLRSFLTAADSPAMIGNLLGNLVPIRGVTPVRFIATAGPSGADYDIEKFDSQGRRSGAAHDRLPPWSWKQIDLGPFLGGVGIEDALLVTVRSGSLDAQASVTAIDTFFLHAIPAGSGGTPSAGSIPEGRWGSPDALEGLHVTESAVFVEGHCRGGVFTQPLRLDWAGRFETTGTYFVDVGPGFSFRARFSGQTDGLTLALSVADEEDPTLSIPTTLYTLGKPYALPPGSSCPVEY